MARGVANSQYLFRRRKSPIWQLRFRLPDGTVKERSLGTPDKDAAKIAAAKEITAHETLMLARRQTRVASIVHGPWVPEYTPGLHTLPDGRSVMATPHDLTFSDGTRRPNGAPVIYLQEPHLLSVKRQFEALDDAMESKLGAGPVTDRPTLVLRDSSPDDLLLEDYIRFGSIKKKNGRGGKPLNATRAAQARKLWATFRQVVNKPLTECGYDDSVKLVAHIEAEHLKKRGEPIKAATVQRMLVPLIAMVTRALVLKKLSGANPFVHVGSSGAESNIVDGYSDAEVALIRKHMHKLDDNDQLLLRMACATGMDRGELFAVKSEPMPEDGIRYITIAKGKTDARPRKVPLPTALVKHKDFPKKITGQLFAGRPDNAGKRLTKFMEGIGIVMDKGIGEDGKHHVLHALHSFRHRAETRLNDAYPGADRLHNAIGGWSNGGKKNARWTYGEFPLRTLKEAIDKIGGL
jgi:integrase